MIGEDTWFIRFYIADSKSDISKKESALWNNLAGRLEGIASVGTFDLGLGIDIEALEDDSPYKELLNYLGVNIAELKVRSLLRYPFYFDVMYILFVRIWYGNVPSFPESCFC